MKRVLNFIKNYWLLVLIVLASILFVANKFSKAPQKVSVSPTPTINKIAEFGEVLPGKTSVDRANELLGFPVKTEKTNKEDVFYYRTTNQYVDHKIAAENGVVKLVKEAVNLEDNKNADTIRGVYGIAPYVLYEQSPNSVFNLYVYPQNGIAYLGGNDGYVFEIWYFEPTTINNFISTWAPNYLEQEYKGQSQY